MHFPTKLSKVKPLQWLKDHTHSTNPGSKELKHSVESAFQNSKQSTEPLSEPATHYSEEPTERRAVVSSSESAPQELKQFAECDFKESLHATEPRSQPFKSSYIKHESHELKHSFKGDSSELKQFNKCGSSEAKQANQFDPKEITDSAKLGSKASECPVQTKRVQESTQSVSKQLQHPTERKSPPPNRSVNSKLEEVEHPTESKVKESTHSTKFRSDESQHATKSKPQEPKHLTDSGATGSERKAEPASEPLEKSTKSGQDEEKSGNQANLVENGESTLCSSGFKSNDIVKLSYEHPENIAQRRTGYGKIYKVDKRKMVRLKKGSIAEWQPADMKIDPDLYDESEVYEVYRVRVEEEPEDKTKVFTRNFHDIDWIAAAGSYAGGITYEMKKASAEGVDKYRKHFLRRKEREAREAQQRAAEEAKKREAEEATKEKQMKEKEKRKR